MPVRTSTILIFRIWIRLIFFVVKRLKIPKSLSEVAKLSSQALRVLRKLCEAKEKIAKLSSEMLRGLHELREALNSIECEIRDFEAFVSNAPRRTRTLRSSQL